ncbi:hypothetical protein JW960_06120 [candidate division KSB1 bacterium]|nr:hypothetical protein [candidate division KSB1 bacterium]
MQPLLNENGHVEALLFTLVDITFQKRNELALQEHKSQLESLALQRTNE